MYVDEYHCLCQYQDIQTAFRDKLERPEKSMVILFDEKRRNLRTPARNICYRDLHQFHFDLDWLRPLCRP